MFFSQCIVSITTATVIMTIVLTLWIFMTELFLDKTVSGSYDRSANGNSGYLFDCRIQYCFNNRTLPVFSKRRIHIFTWLFVFFIFPTILLKFGIAVSAHFKTDFIYNIAMWMPSNFFQINTANVNMSSCITAWDTTGGMLRCIIAGISGIIIFMAIGFRHIRKADL